MYHRVLCIFFVVAVAFIAVSSGTGVCTGYPKMYNGKPCASTTRYWDNNMGACGCGTGNTSPFAWQFSKPTAAASAPIFGSGTWCGSGCGKCFKLTPTAVGASPIGKGATNLNSLVVKVTNLCPYSGNEEWCAMDVNSHDYDAHFDLMDQNMNGIITAQGWDNPEVTYEEVDCAANGYGDWSCQCASGGSSGNTATTKPVATTAPTTKPTAKATTKATAVPTTKATTAPTTKATTAPTKATTAPTTKATTAPTAKATAAATAKPTAPSTPVGTSIKVQVKSGVNAWWFGFGVADTSAFSKVEIMDSALKTWTTLAYQGDAHWGMFYINPKSELKLPLSLRFTSSKDGKTVTASNIITSFTAGDVDAKVAL